MRSFFIMALLALSLLACKQHKSVNQAEADAKPVTVELAISGMMCQGCVETVRSSIAQLQGIDTVIVSLEKANALVTFRPGRTDTLSMRKAIELNGYKVLNTKNIEH